MTENLLGIPHGAVHSHLGTRIVFVECVDGQVLRWVVEGTEEEYFVEAADGIWVRPTIAYVLNEFGAERWVVCGAGEATLSEWRGRFLGLDRAAILARQPTAVAKYELAMAALVAGKARSADALRTFAEEFLPQGTTVPSGRTIIRAMNNLEKFERRIGAACNRSGREKGRSQLPPIVDRLVHQATAVFYSGAALKKMDADALVKSAWYRLKERGVEGLGEEPPSKTTVINRINACENMQSVISKFGPHDADRQFLASGEPMPVSRPFQLVYIDGTEFEQVCHFSSKARIPSSKMKTVATMDAATLFAFPHQVFSGPYRAEMGMGAMLGALTPPVLDDDTKAADPMRSLFFGRLGRLRGDNDRALIPPNAIANLTGVITRVELAARYGSDEKSNLENYFGWLKKRLDLEPGTVLSPRSRRRSIRRDPLKEDCLTRADFARRVEALRLEWNDTGHEAIGWRKPNDLVREHVLEHGTRFIPPGETRRHLARTVPGVLTTDGVWFDGILYRWNRTGVTKLLSENLAAQAFASRLEGTARCEVWLRVYDWNLDYIDVLNEAATGADRFVTLWSTDPDYTSFLTRFEHTISKARTRDGSTGAQTANERARRRGEALHDAWRDLETERYAIAKKAAAFLECAEMRENGRNLADDPDLSDFSDLLILTDPAGRDGVGVPRGPSQNGSTDTDAERAGSAETSAITTPATSLNTWGDLDPAPRSNLQMLEAEQQEEDLDDGVDWEAADDKSSDDVQREIDE